MRKPTRIGTWNVLSLNPPGHTTLLSAELSRLNVCIAGLQEVRWTGSGELLQGDYKLLWSGHESHQIQGAALAINRRFASSIVSWRPLGSRMLYTRLRHNLGYISIFVCYAPTENSDLDTKDSFYHLLDDELRRISRHDITLVLGDMNATVGSNRTSLEHIIGPHPFANVATNDNGDRLLNICSTHNLKVLNTWYQHRNIHRTTWYSNTGALSKTLDYILVSGRWNVASDCRVYRSAELGRTDHRLLVATCHLRLRRTIPPPVSSRRPDITKLKDPDFSNRYAIEVRNRFAALHSPETIEGDWEQLRSTLTPAASSVLGECRSRKKPWISNKSLDLVDRCRSARLNRHSATYKELNRQRRRSLRHDYATWLKQIAEEAELKFQQNNLRPAYKAIRSLCEVSRFNRSSPLLSDDGSTITDVQSKLARWKQHYTCALNKPHPPPSLRLQAFANSGVVDTRVPLDPPSLSEIFQVIRKLPKGRAPGLDGITGEMLQSASDSIVPRLHQLCKRVWEEERVPPEWKEGVILPLYKSKGDRRNTSSYRPITLLSVPSKVVTAIILKRIHPLILEKRRPQQAGFTPNRSTTDCILTLTVLAQQLRSFRKPLLAAYVDLRAAFDSLDRDTLWLLLQGIGVEGSTLPCFAIYIPTLYAGFDQRAIYQTPSPHLQVFVKVALRLPTSLISPSITGCEAHPLVFAIWELTTISASLTCATPTTWSFSPLRWISWSMPWLSLERKLPRLVCPSTGPKLRFSRSRISCLHLRPPLV